jgi:hypothetical protein
MSLYNNVVRFGGVTPNIPTTPSYSFSASPKPVGGHQFSFVSTGTQYVGRTCTANASYTATWLIEGTTYSALSPGTVALSSSKLIFFDLTPPTQLTRIDVNNNTLTGALPSLGSFTALQQLQCNSNSLTGSIPSISANTALTIFNVAANSFTGVIPSLTTNTLLSSFQCLTNSLTGSIPDLSANTALTYFDCSTNQLTGNIPSLSANASLGTFRCSSNQLSGVAAGFAVPAALHIFNASSNLLPQAAIDAILAAFVTAGASGAYTLNLGGTGNASPSAAGLADKATLAGRGWTVTTN